jgi:hypothetical protein
MRFGPFAAPAVVLALFLSAPLAAAPPSPEGSEFFINTDTSSTVDTPAVAFDRSGNALAVWENEVDGLRARYISAAGPLGSEMGLVAQTNLPTFPGQGHVVERESPTAVFVPNGNFILFWTEERDYLEALPLFENVTLLGRDVYMQVFQPDGTAVSGPTRVNTTTRGYHQTPKAIWQNGNVLVVWEGQSRNLTPIFIDGIFGRLVSPAGAFLTPEFEITSQASIAHRAALAFDSASKTTLVTWQGSLAGANGYPDGVNIQVFGQFVGAKAQLVGGNFQVSTGTPIQQVRPAVTTDGQGHFLVLWQENYQDIWHARIDGQFVGTTGNLVGPILKIEGEGPLDVAPALAPTTNGHFLAMWLEFNGIYPIGLHAVEIGPTGTLGNEFWVNQNEIYPQTEIDLATDGHGAFVIPYVAFVNNVNYGIAGRWLTGN